MVAVFMSRIHLTLISVHVLLVQIIIELSYAKWEICPLWDAVAAQHGGSEKVDLLPMWLILLLLKHKYS